MANKILIFPKLALDGTPDGFFALKMIDVGGGFFRLRLLDQSDSDYPQLASAIPDTGDQLETGPAGSIGIGIPVTGGNPLSVLFVGPTGLLAADAAFIFDPAAETLRVGDGLQAGMIQLGGITNQFPAIAHDGTDITLILADGSARANLFVGDISAENGSIKAGISGVQSGSIGISSQPGTDGEFFFETQTGEITALTAPLATATRSIQLPDADGIVALTNKSVVPDANGRVITTAESDSVFTNEGAAALAVFTLPAAAANLVYTFVVQDADGIEITAAGGDTIRIAGSVSSAGGTATSTDIGSALILVAINATEWMAISSVGTWVLA